jgi:hypothetical protein
MPFVVRDAGGNILAVHAAQSDAAPDEVAADDPALLAFLGLQSDVTGDGKELVGHLLTSDSEMVRVVEDLIDVLIAKRVIMMTDLPAAARAKLAKRRGLRGKLKDLSAIVAPSEEMAMP